MTHVQSDMASDIPTIPGTPFGGGFYAGRFLLDDRLNALIVAPKSEGEADLKWKTRNSSTDGARSRRDGMANSAAMANANHPAAAFCRDLKIGGFEDWYLPSRHEAALLAEVFMPGEGYVPEQTVAESFKEGEAEAFDRTWYWTSTEFSAGSAWLQGFGDGAQASNSKDSSFRVRAVRKCQI